MTRKVAPAPTPGVHLEAAVVVGHEALGDRETEPGALPRRLGGEEGIEHARQDVVGNARALVRERDLDLRRVAPAGGHGQGPVPVHRVEGVAGEPQEHLAELALVDDHVRQLRVETPLEPALRVAGLRARSAPGPCPPAR